MRRWDTGSGGTETNKCGWGLYSLSRLWYWFQGYIYVKTSNGTFKICVVLPYINYISIKL